MIAWIIVAVLVVILVLCYREASGYMSEISRLKGENFTYRERCASYEKDSSIDYKLSLLRRYEQRQIENIAYTLDDDKCNAIFNVYKETENFADWLKENPDTGYDDLPWEKKN